MLGMNEILLILAVIAIVAIFGRKTIRKLATDFFAVKKDVKKIKEDSEKPKAKPKKKAKAKKKK
jgi:Sec-independent protein translocase protein TatA